MSNHEHDHEFANRGWVPRFEDILDSISSPGLALTRPGIFVLNQIRNVKVSKPGALTINKRPLYLRILPIPVRKKVFDRKREEYHEGGPIPANRFLIISGLAIQGMLLEIDITAVVPK